MVMLFTDGGTDHADDIFNHYNPQKNMVWSLFMKLVFNAWH